MLQPRLGLETPPNKPMGALAPKKLMGFLAGARTGLVQLLSDQVGLIHGCPLASTVDLHASVQGDMLGCLTSTGREGGQCRGRCEGVSPGEGRRGGAAGPAPGARPGLPAPGVTRAPAAAWIAAHAARWAWGGRACAMDEGAKASCWASSGTPSHASTGNAAAMGDRHTRVHPAVLPVSPAGGGLRRLGRLSARSQPEGNHKSTALPHCAGESRGVAQERVPAASSTRLGCVCGQGELPARADSFSWMRKRARLLPRRDPPPAARDHFRVCPWCC